jgi:cold-inducible RNA-binding protein
MGTRLFIGNLSYNVNEQELREAFSGEGIEVRSVRVALDRDTGRPRGFAFVETATDEGAKASIEKLSGRLMQGRAIIIEEAQAKPMGAARPAGGPAGAPPRPGGFGPPRAPGAAPGAPGAAPGGPPRAGGGGFGPPRPPGSGPPPRSGGFGTPRGPGFAGGGGGGSFDPRFQSGGPPRGAGDAPRRERPEKKRSTRPKPEERERGNWRWNGKVDED